jgi:ketosteroid isomerase-like protein
MEQDKRGHKYAQMPAGNVKRYAFLLILLFTGAPFFGSEQTKKQQDMTTASNDEAAIRALEDRFTAAFNAGDINAMMKNYIPDNSLVVFDVVPRKEYLGADAYRRNWADFFSHFKGTPKIAITDLGITADGSVGFSHSFQRVTGTDMQGHPVDRTVRVTDGYRKIGGNWLIVLEHISVPVDLGRTN